MREMGAIVRVVLPILLCAAVLYPQAPPAGNAGGRGEYLVDEVARCGECHTPKDAQRNWDEAKWLQGAGCGSGP
jgi:mono/diheme cytochrome c family protein